MGNLPRSITDFFDVKAILAYKAPLIGTTVLARGVDLPLGTGTVSRDQVEYPVSKAKRGYRVREVPRETAERTPKTVTVIEHTHGFDLHKNVLAAYARMGEAALNGTDATNSGRLVAESFDDVVFNGDSNAGTKGIYSDAGLTPYAVDDGKEWNDPTGAAPDEVIVECIGELEASQKYLGLDKKLILSPLPYNALLKRVPQTSATYMDFVAKLFKNGVNDIYRTTALANGTGLLEYYGTEVAERNVELDIETYAVQGGVPDKNNLIYFNVETYQATDIHHLDAFLPITNLWDTG
ncbi:encapsulin [Methanobacterium spitsbergense]|uniref:Bacteriocin family protein n=1 Tax=Methanobacterium spitsbergense TaxID=2874285 RepID=A0A8T5UTH0_9EURY|nr:encapsulin [Methanobacterium spitsbergense]MBZ2167004.1 bacteriocin family protein [Methanobacterium spitsbergense]